MKLVGYEEKCEYNSITTPTVFYFLDTFLFFHLTTFHNFFSFLVSIIMNKKLFI